MNVYIPNASGKGESLREGIWLTTKLEKPTVSKRDTKGFFKRRSRVIIPRSKIHFSIWIGYNNEKGYDDGKIHNDGCFGLYGGACPKSFGGRK
jgi:hypothetical protein